MKKLLFALLISLPFLAGAQVTYRIDAISGGGFYLVEVVKDTAGRVNEFPQRFNTPEQLTAYINYLRDQAAGNAKQADKILADATAEAKKLKDTAPRITAAAAAIEATGKDYFNPKPVTAPTAPTKPAKGKKTKTKQ